MRRRGIWGEKEREGGDGRNRMGGAREQLGALLDGSLEGIK
jgi:hypothetical protein